MFLLSAKIIAGIKIVSSACLVLKFYIESDNTKAEEIYF